ncbi:hypothetical protein [Moorena producens]|uniref:hypothetical protein n=1 Tax=Moorena producens TaxID=1155739 RepID=UPI003C740A41
MQRLHAGVSPTRALHQDTVTVQSYCGGIALILGYHEVKTDPKLFTKPAYLIGAHAVRSYLLFLFTTAATRTLAQSERLLSPFQMRCKPVWSCFLVQSNSVFLSPLAFCLLPVAFFSKKCVYNRDKNTLSTSSSVGVAHRLLASLTLYSSKSFSEKLSGIYLEGREHLIEGKEKLK